MCMYPHMHYMCVRLYVCLARARARVCDMNTVLLISIFVFTIYIYHNNCLILVKIY